MKQPVFVIDEKLIEKEKPSLLLHSCCAPCSSSVLEILVKHFEVTVLYYNPNIFPESEYYKRCKEQERFCTEFIPDQSIRFVSADWDSEDFAKIAKGFENEPEGNARCNRCFLLRLEKTAQYAKKHGFDCFTTTLSVSPLKDAKKLNEIGKALGEKYSVSYLESDFKKQNGYKRSCELSKQYDMYRQDFCGCIYSLAERIMSAKGFVFDADGTLFDTMGFYEDFAPSFVRSFGLVPDDDLREQIRSMTILECAGYLKEKYNLTADAEEIEKMLNRKIYDLYNSEVELKDGVREFLDYARLKGIKLCIATATRKEFIELALRKLGMEDVFEFVLTCADVGASKRESTVYDESVKKLGLSQRDVVVFEDAHHAIVTAKSAGYKIVAVRDETELKFKDIIIQNSDVYVDSMMNLIRRENLSNN